MAEVKAGTTSEQKAQLVKVDRKGKGTKQDMLVINYVSVETNETKTAQKFFASVTDGEKTLLQELKEGDLFLVVKEAVSGRDRDGNSRMFWNLKTVKSIADYKPKEKSSYNGGGGYNKGATNTKTGGYDNLGQQIGNSMTNAVNSLGAGKTIEEYRARALEFVLAGDYVRAQIENKTATNTANTANTNTSSTKTAGKNSEASNNTENNADESFEFNDESNNSDFDW